MTRRGLLLRLAMAMSLIATACSSELTNTQPASTDPSVIATGEQLYQARCAECHGTDLRGTDRGPSHLSQVYRSSHHGDVVFGLAIIRGVSQHHWSFGDMPAVTGLNDTDIEAIVSYVRAAQASQGLDPYPP